MIDGLISIVVIVILSLYFVQAIVLCFGVKSSVKKRRDTQDFEPCITIIVPARNEEANIQNAISSLRKIEYPHEKTEIIIVDDHSDDSTAEIVACLTKKDRRFRLLTTSNSDARLNGKANAVDFGIEQSSGEIIFVTDADCRVPNAWVRAHLHYYEKKIGMVGGFALLTGRGLQHSLFARLQSLDWFYLCAVGSGSAGMGMPLSVFGNNFSFRRKAYNQVGGFRGAGFSVIEDFALMRAFLKQTDWRIALPADPDLVIQTLPAVKLRDFYLQRKRWVLGGKTVSLFGTLILTLGFSGRILPLVLAIYGNASFAMLSFIAVALSDLSIAGFAARVLRRIDQLRPVLLYTFFAMGYSLFFAPIFLLAKSVRWKNREYRVE